MRNGIGQHRRAFTAPVKLYLGQYKNIYRVYGLLCGSAGWPALFQRFRETQAPLMYVP